MTEPLILSLARHQDWVKTLPPVEARNLELFLAKSLFLRGYAAAESETGWIFFHPGQGLVFEVPTRNLLLALLAAWDRIHS